MKLKKIELGLEGDQYWPRICIVHVPGNTSAAAIPEGASQQEAEEIIRSWKQVAVLRVTPADGRAMVGFAVGPDRCQYLNVPVETTADGQFAMRMGDGNSDFFVIPQDHKTNYQLDLVQVTNINDPNYPEVPVY